MVAEKLPVPLQRPVGLTEREVSFCFLIGDQRVSAVTFRQGFKDFSRKRGNCHGLLRAAQRCKASARDLGSLIERLSGEEIA
jgi:hypothetical protein